MSFISESQLASYRTKTITFSADNIVNLKESTYSDKSRPMIFLSHKHDEHTILQDVIAFLKNEGVDVYVDWMDSSMPAYTNAETAHKLKQKIKVADKFILLATQNAINSKWCNWELGLGDAEKYINNIALLPINRSNQTFYGAEYLRIYPRIEYQDGSTQSIEGAYISKGYYVIYPEDKDGNSRLFPLKNWLKL
ncbi:toll/interleukin-1 receptor domain-containing protein [Myroides odoratimimus]|uniref:toll/interleukin-1 receptor domain-containing protein n=1 Tax=Myroides odoratimimus TaxID=76832 RepID=UPI001CE0348C|nr:toll/interleukin-1 receptor domain-containing protein [Myroides odoratimimus]MCA4793917.1 toll/interleukin-1 receptor domain-containing protein [Myroides odoratimimus]MCA4821183.1 toll/interleukin-1 receptor domain-containing protein [Myroides odoratimimus]MDM1504210.1 toll/interleukin-1 receptor domain-containing protein [Myroides odoratimimus]